MSDNYTHYPIKNHAIYEFVKKIKEMFWIDTTIDLSQDRIDMDKLKTSNEALYHFIVRNLTFFAVGDIIVGKNLIKRFMNEEIVSRIPEIEMFYCMQSGQEFIHAEFYNKMIDACVRNDVEREHIKRALSTIPAVAKKGQWAIKWMEDTDDPYIIRLFAYGIVEIVFFANNFNSINYVKKRGYCKGLGEGNRYIQRDEWLHGDFAAHLIKNVLGGLALYREKCYTIMREAVEIEDEFTKYFTTDGCLDEITVEKNMQYTRFIADFYLQMCGLDKIYNVECPYERMYMESIESKTDFFYSKPKEYALHEVSEDSLFS